jgi:hypothetical protein
MLSVSILYNVDNQTINEDLAEWEMEGEIFAQNSVQWLFVHHKSNMNWPGIENGTPGRETGD